MRLEITSRCEQPCAECRPAGDDAGDLDLELLRGVLAALRPLGLPGPVVAGGEPILHPRFDELLALVCRDGRRPALRSHGRRAAEYVRRLAPFREHLAHVRLPLRAYAGGPAGAAEAIDAYRAAGHDVVVEHVVDEAGLDGLVAVGELVAAKSVTLALRAEPSWQASPGAQASLMPRLGTLGRLLGERLVLEPSLGFNHAYAFCSNFSLLDRVTLRANGDVLFCHLCPAGERSGLLGNVRDEPPGAILGRHPRRVGAIWSARLALMASAPPALANNCAACQETLRATAAAAADLAREGTR